MMLLLGLVLVVVFGLRCGEFVVFGLLGGFLWFVVCLGCLCCVGCFDLLVCVFSLLVCCLVGLSGAILAVLRLSLFCVAFWLCVLCYGAISVIWAVFLVFVDLISWYLLI